MTDNTALDKSFNIRLPKDLWVFLKKLSADQETSMNEIVITLIKRHRKNVEKRIDE